MIEQSFEDCIEQDMEMLKRTGVIAATCNGIGSKSMDEDEDALGSEKDH